jgi:hypothetical protein
MNILQFESLNLEFIWKRYEINNFWSLKYTIRSYYVITKKVRGLFIRIQGHARKTTGRRVDSRKPEGLFNKITREGVSSLLNHQILNQQPR